MDLLKKIYPSFISYDEVHEDEKVQYKWFKTKEDEVVGILKEQMTSNELALLNLLLTPHDVQFPVETKEEQEWKKAIETGQTELLVIQNGYRFVAFSFNPAQMTPFQFKIAICELFGREVPIIWENESEGLMIEVDQDEAMTYEEMIDVLMSDLYVNIQFLVGVYDHHIENLSMQYEVIQEAAYLSFTHSEKNVVTLIEAIPYFFMYGKGKADRERLRALLLQDFIEDPETIEMIEVFIHNNLNVSETAKAMHLHRNSLQYRLDRLVARTGIDIRKVHHAMAVYLLL